MKDSMPQRGFNYSTDVQRFFPNPINGVDEFNRQALRDLKRKGRDYRGKHQYATSKRVKIKGQTVLLRNNEFVLKGKVVQG